MPDSILGHEKLTFRAVPLSGNLLAIANVREESVHKCYGGIRILLVFWGTWVAQSIKHPTLAQVMISRFMGSRPALGSVLTAQSLEPALDPVSPSVLPLFCSRSLSFSKIKINIKKIF